MITQGGPSPLQPQPRAHRNGEHAANLRGRRRRPPPEMDDLAYLVNQVQERDPPILHAYARFADEAREPTVHVFEGDTDELIWQVTLTDLVQLAARFLRVNPGLMLEAHTRVGQTGPAPRAATPAINDLAFLVNQARIARGQILHAQAELVEHEPGQEPTAVIVNSATDEVLVALPLTDLLRLAKVMRLDTGLVIEHHG